MSELKPADRALFDLARDGHDPTDEDRTRVHAALMLRLGGGAGLAGAGVGVARASSVLALTKVVAGVVVAGAIGSAGLATYRVAHRRPPVVAISSSGLHPPPAVAQSPEPSAAASVRSPAPAIPIVAQLPSLTHPPPSGRSFAVTAGVEAPATAPPVTIARGRETVATSRSIEEAPPPNGLPFASSDHRSGEELGPAGAPPPQPSLLPSSLDAETRLVRRGVAALHAGDAIGALTLFDQHARAFPNGALAEERDGERAIALCELHRTDEARDAASAFLRTYPRSPLAVRVHSSCAARPNP